MAIHIKDICKLNTYKNKNCRKIKIVIILGSEGVGALWTTALEQEKLSEVDES